MRIGEVNKDNYTSFLNLISRMSKKGTHINDPLKGLEESLSDSISGGSSLIDDIRAGNLTNSYGVKGMDITGKTGWRRIVPVSDKMVDHVIADVKEAFYERGGMSSGIQAEDDAYYDKIHAYIKTVDEKDRSAAAWTLNQIGLDMGIIIEDAVKAQDPTWTPGKHIDSKVLDKIFEDNDFKSKYKNTAATIKFTGIDTRV